MANAFVHTELTTGNVDAAHRFYAQLFKWKMRNLGPDMGHYVMIDYGDKNAGGGIQAPQMPGQPSSWMPYVEVKSVKESIAKASDLGAQIMVPYQAIGNMGAIGVFVDPQGAALGVWEKAPAPKKAPKKKSSSKKASSKKASSSSKKSSSKKASSKKVAKKKR